MKQLFCFSFLLLFVLHTSAQPTSALMTHPERWQRSKVQRTTGFVFLGSGILLTAIGIASVSKNFWADIINGVENVGGTGALIAGVSLAAASVPLFILAGKNRKASFSFLPVNSWHWTRYSSPYLQLTFTQKLF
jgi:hypothetical protein